MRRSGIPHRLGLGSACSLPPGTRTAKSALSQGFEERIFIGQCYGLGPQAEVLTPPTQNVTIFGYRVFTKVVKQK